MTTRGFVIKVGGVRPWLGRYLTATPTQAQPAETLRGAQAVIEASANQPLRWRQLVDAQNVPTSPETWVAEDFAQPPVVVGGAGPWLYAPGLLLSVIVDGNVGMPAQATVQAGAAVAVGQVAGDYTLAPGVMSVIVYHPSGPEIVPVTVPVAPAGAMDATATAAWLNANAVLPGSGMVFSSDVASNTLQVETVGQGTGFAVDVQGGSALATSLGFTSASTVAVGTGNVPDAANITAANAATLLSTLAASGVVSSVDPTSGLLTLTGTTPGHAYTLQVDLTASTAPFGFDGNIHYGT